MPYEYLESHRAGNGDTIVEGARRMFAFFDKHVKPDTNRAPQAVEVPEVTPKS